MAKKKTPKTNSSEQSASNLVILFLLFLATVGVFFLVMKTKSEESSMAVEGAATRAAETKDLKRPPCLSIGDVDGDGKTTEKDAAEIVRKMQGLNPNKRYISKNADVDGDKRITPKDKELILKYAQRKISTLPICPKGQKCTNASDCPDTKVCEKGYCVPQRPIPTKAPITKYPYRTTAPVR